MNKLQYGIDYFVPETNGSPVKEGFMRFWYAEYYLGKFSYSAPLDCTSEKVFENWLELINSQTDNYNVEWRKLP